MLEQQKEKQRNKTNYIDETKKMYRIIIISLVKFEF